MTNVLRALADHVRAMRAKIQSLDLATWKLLMTPAKDILVARRMWGTERSVPMTDKIGRSGDSLEDNSYSKVVLKRAWGL